MKKGILVTAILLISCFVLSGCISGVPHKMLSSPWAGYEKAVYEVTRTLKDGDSDIDNNPKINGTSTVTTQRIKKGSVTVGSMTMNDFDGSFVEILTELEDGSRMEASFAFGNGKPYMSYKKIDIKGYEHNDPESDLNEETTAEYKDKKYIYNNVTNGVTVKGEIDLKKQWEKAPYFDSLSVYHIVRSSYDNLEYTSIALNVPNWKDNVMKTLNTSLLAHEITFKDTIAPEVKCDQIAIQLNQTFPGSGLPLIATITLEEVTIDNMIIPIKTLYAFTEGDTSYKLKTIEFRK